MWLCIFNLKLVREVYYVCWLSVRVILVEVRLLTKYTYPSMCSTVYYDIYNDWHMNWRSNAPPTPIMVPPTHCLTKKESLKNYAYIFYILSLSTQSILYSNVFKSQLNILATEKFTPVKPLSFNLHQLRQRRKPLRKVFVPTYSTK